MPWYRWVRMVFLFGFIIGVFCFTGFNYAVWNRILGSAMPCMMVFTVHTYIHRTQLQHIAPLVYSSLLLLDPAVTAVLSWVLGVEPLPGKMVWAGGAVVLAGQVDLPTVFSTVTVMQLLVVDVRGGIDIHRGPLAE